MKLGIDSYSYHLNLGQYEYRPVRPKDTNWLLNRATELGVQGVMLMELGQGVSEDTLKGIRSEADSRGLYIELGGGGTGPKSVARDLQLAAALGARVIKVTERVDRWSKKVSLFDQLQRLVTNLQQATGMAKGMGIRLALENHGRLTADENLWVIERVASDYVGFCLDTGNSLLLQEDATETVTAMAPYAFTTHFKDAAFRGTPYGAEILHVGLGAGVLNLPKLYKIIRALAPDPNINIEVVSAPRDTEEESLEAEDQTVAASVRYARDVLGIAA
jgi:sugar phosphate isomerase/epimerase